MAIYGIGATYKRDVSSDFISEGVACVGWSQVDSPPLYRFLGKIRNGDLIFIKSHPPNIGLIVKAVGIVTDDVIAPETHLGGCIEVEWIWQGYDVIGKIKDRYNVRNNTIYEELNPEVQRRIIELLLSQLNRQVG